MVGRTDSRRRLILLLLAFGVAAGATSIRLMYWQVDQREALAALAHEQLTVRVEEPQVRGDITDRTGLTVLATTVRHDRLVASPRRLSREQRAAVADALVALLGLSGAEADGLVAKMMSDADYVVLGRGLDEETAIAIRAAHSKGALLGVALEPEPVRIYPQEGGAPETTLAAHLLGFVNRDGIGQYGVEEFYQKILAGTPRILLGERDIANRPIDETATVIDPGAAGSDLRLTIDAGLQLQIEGEIFAAWVADRASSVSAIVMDPRTGAILATATYPSYDANAYAATAARETGRFLDPVVSAVYEPGSVFKMMTAAAALEKKVVSLKTRINDYGRLILDGGRTRIYDADKRARGWMTFEDIVAYSRNVGAAQAALRLGRSTRSAATVLYRTWRKLGFGSPTGIDLANEVAGLVRDPVRRPWAQIDLANGSFGQGVAVTPIQLAVAFATMVNGGKLVQPHVVAAVDDRAIRPKIRGQVISASLSKTLTGLMRHVVTTVPFYKNRTLIKGYRVGGKTGTAQIWDPRLAHGRGSWKENIFNFSFVGYIGRTRPELVVVVTIRDGRPDVIRQGNLELPVQSFELFRRIATDAAGALDMAPQRGRSGSGGR